MSTATAVNMDDEGEKDANDTSVSTDGSKASAGTAHPQKPRLRIDAVDVDWLFSDQGDNPFVTIMCGDEDKSFVVLKSILTRNSDFFQKCLNEPWAESQSPTVHLPDVKPEYMELYLRLATRQALLNTVLETKSLVQLRDFLHRGHLSHYLIFYKTCDYLQNTDLAKAVKEMFFEYMGNHVGPKNEDEWKIYFRAFAASFDLLEPGHPIQRRLQRRIVKTFCARVTSKVYLTYCDMVKTHHAFIFEVNKQYALNIMWTTPATRTAAAGIKTQRMRVDDDSEVEE